MKKLFTKATLTRTLSSVILVVLALYTLITGGTVLFATLLIISLIGQFEIYRVIGMQRSLPALTAYGTAAAYYILLLADRQEHTMLLMILSLMLLMAVYVCSFPKYRAEQLCFTYFGFFYVAVMMSFIYEIRMLENGVLLVFLVFISAWVCDTCAYLAGVMLGRHKLAPKLSPKKSIEGSIGGIVGAVAVGALYGWLFQEGLLEAFVNPAVGCAIVCGAGAVISQVGDLAASGIKRNYEVKDYGHLIPGHGGIMDRFDSVIFVAPAVYFLTLFIG